MALTVRDNVKESMPMAMYQCRGTLLMCGQSEANQPTSVQVNDVASGQVSKRIVFSNPSNISRDINDKTEGIITTASFRFHTSGTTQQRYI